MIKSVVRVDICRTCTRKDRGMKPIFGLEVNSVSISYILSTVTPLIIHPNDGLPDTLCKDCLTSIISFYKFQQMCLESDEKLRLSINNAIQNEVMNVNATGVPQEQTQNPIETYNSISNNANQEKEVHSQINWKTPGPSQNTDVYEEGNVVLKIETGEFKCEVPNEQFSQNNERMDTDITSEQINMLVKYTSHSIISSNEKQIQIPINTISTIAESQNQNSSTDLISSHQIPISNESIDCIQNTQGENSIIECISIPLVTDELCGSYQQDLDETQVQLNNDFNNIRQNNVTIPINTCYECDQCGKSFDSLEERTVHYCQLSNEGERKFENGVMTENVLCQSGLQVELCPTSQKTTTEYKTRKDKIQCDYCGIIICYSSLVRHVKRIHPKELKTFLIKLNKQKIKKNRKTIYKCTTCKKVFQKNNHLAMHQKTHIKQKSLEEIVINNSMTETDSYANDKENQEENDVKNIKDVSVENQKDNFNSLPHFPCKICGKTFTKSIQRREHMLKHGFNTYVLSNYKCIECEKKFQIYATYDLHMTKKHNRSNLDCKICNREYSSIYNLKRHLKNIHNVGTKYLDTENSKNSSKTSTTITIEQPSNQNNVTLNESRRETILKNNSRKCLQCEISYSNQSNLMRHVKNKHGDIYDKYYQKETTEINRRSLCNKSFNRHEDLVQQRRQNEIDTAQQDDKQDKKKFECYICLTKYVTIWSVRRHLRKIHGMDVELARKKYVTLQCCECDTFLIDEHHFQFHIKRYHEDIISTKDGNKKNTIQKRIIYTCKICRQISLSPHEHKNYFKIHQKQK